MTTPSDLPDARLREVSFAPADQPLSDDVNRLGALVGEMLAEQRGDDFLALIESIRTAAIRRRERGEAEVVLQQHLEAMAPGTAEAVVRAFATYFNAVNLAERVHRIRRRRDYQRAGSAPQPGSLRAVLEALKADGVDLDTLAQWLPRLRLELVFTAHPTEAMRRALLEKEQDVVRGLLVGMDPSLTAQERHAERERIRTAITAAWQTAESPPTRPTVADELEHVGFYLAEVIYRVLPVFHEALDDAIQAVYGAPLPLPLPRALAFGSWVGGDMDGNPNVGAATIEATLTRQRQMVIAAYRRDLVRLSGLLSQSPERVGIAAAIDQRIAHYRESFPQAAARERARHADMPYRALLALLDARLTATAAGDPSGYARPEAFESDLELIRASLDAHRGERAGGFRLRRVLCRLRAFGFHLATLDVRQDATVHAQALAACLGEEGFATADPATRATRLTALLAEPARVRDIDTLAEPARGTLAVFRALATARRSYGSDALGPYIVSMSHSAADALAVLALAHLAGDDAAASALDVAPLFETVADLEAAPDTLRALLAEPRYRSHVAARGDSQMVMLGYSDSAKDAGMLAARFALQQAQIALLGVGREFGVRIVFFHGRGGSISRGGGKAENAVIAAPRGSVDGHLRVTEQGEVIHRRYGIRALALRNFEQVAGAVLRVGLRPRKAEPREAIWRERAREMAGASREAYRALVHEEAEFPAYFREATPIDLIERLRLGSRPAKRAGTSDIGALRAIPWVFAWAQTRGNLTAWYGVGSGLAHGLAAWGREAMVEMTADWPFFAILMDDLEMALAKADLGIFEGYSRLSALHERLFPRICAEFERTCAAVLALRDADELLSHDPRLRRSIRLRNPYVDPINLLQQGLLRRWRADGRPDDATYRALVATVNGISAGIQNTG